MEIALCYIYLIVPVPYRYSTGSRGSVPVSAVRGRVLEPSVLVETLPTVEDTQTHQFGPNLYPPPTPTTTIWNLNTSARIVNSELLNNLLHSEFKKYLLVVIL